MRVLILLLMMVSVAFALNPQTIYKSEIKFEQSGIVSHKGIIRDLKIILSIPEKGDVLSFPKGQIIYDTQGNRKIVLKIPYPKKKVEYRIVTILNNTAFFLNNTCALEYENVDETGLIVITDEIREKAHEFTNDLNGIANMVSFVHDYIIYDEKYRLKPSDWIFKYRRGVCSEYSTLLIALLRAKNIKARYVSGYAYSNKENRFLGHAWVEVKTTCGWIPADPTFMQFAYLDATHIKIAHLQSLNQTDVIFYRGYGTVSWEKNENIVLLNYKPKNIVNLSVNITSSGTQGVLNITLQTNTCTFIPLNVYSCVDKNKNDVLDIYPKHLNLYTCGKKNIYIGFRSTLNKNFVCPIVINAINSKTITLKIVKSRVKKSQLVYPKIAYKDEIIRISSDKEGLFFYEDFAVRTKVLYLNTSNFDNNITLFFFDKALIPIKIKLNRIKPFEVFIQHEQNATKRVTFNITIINLLNKSQQFFIKASTRQSTSNLSLTLSPREEKTLTMNINTTTGRVKIIVEIFGKDYRSTSFYINVREEENLFLFLLKKIIKIFERFLF